MPVSDIADPGAVACAYVQELLGALDTKAARENRTVDMFVDEQRFGDVFQRRKDVSDAVSTVLHQRAQPFSVVDSLK